MPEELRNIVPLLVVVFGLIAVFWYGRHRRGRSRKSDLQFSDKTLDDRQRLRKAVEKLQLNLMEFGRDVEGRLDTRIHTLGRLIQDADERIKRLEELSGKTPAQPGQEVPALHLEVYRLADSGLDKVEIARRTSTTPGEVDLILGLRRTRSE